MDLLLAYYGDDFTGSTDALEALTRGGVPTVLFVEPPTVEMLLRYPHARAIGIAGSSRTMSPDQMDAALPDAFGAMLGFAPRFVHYKVCSTFDSSPQVGSIGRAIDIGHRVFQNRFVPLVVGAPVLQRFCVFGNLFARSGLDSAPFRLDRHPTMRRHPVTPMTEADLRVCLSSQTDRPVALVDVLALETGYESAARKLADVARAAGQVILFDTLTDAHFATIGRLIADAQRQEAKPLFVAGSSGVEYALTKHWQAAGDVPAAAGETAGGPALSRARPVDRTLVVSASCSPVTDRQIGWALAHGFAELAVDTPRLLQSTHADAEIDTAVNRIRALLDAGQSVIAHSSRGPDDSRLAAAPQSALARASVSEQIGVILGRILREVQRTHRLDRVAVAGGDTSGYVARSLGINALEMAAPLAPGAPLCVARSRVPEFDGVEITFKGGQVGCDDFFGTLVGG